MSPRDRRAVLIGGAVLATAFVLRASAYGLWSIADHRADLRTASSFLEKARQQIGSIHHLEDSAAVVRERLVALAPDLLPAGGPAEMAAIVAGRLNALAEASRVRLLATELLSDSVAPPGVPQMVRRVRLKVGLESDLEGVLGLVAALEAGQPTLVVERLMVHSLQPVSLEAPETLQGELILTGLALADSGESR